MKSFFISIVASIILSVVFSVKNTDNMYILSGIVPYIIYWVFLLSKKQKLSPKQIDSIYYYGFLMTIAMMAIAVIEIGIGRIDKNNILIQFGFGLAYTGLGVVLRYFLIPDELSAEDVKNNPNLLLEQINNTLYKIESNNKTYMNNLTEVNNNFVADAKTELQDSLATIKDIAKNYAAISVDFGKIIDDNKTALTKNTAQQNKLSEKLAENFNDHDLKFRKILNNLETELGKLQFDLAIDLTPINNKIQEESQKLDFSQIQANFTQITQEFRANISKINQSVNEFKEVLDNNRANFKPLDKGLDKFNKTLDTVEKNLASLEKFRDVFNDIKRQSETGGNATNAPEANNATIRADNQEIINILAKINENLNKSTQDSQDNVYNHLIAENAKANERIYEQLKQSNDNQSKMSAQIFAQIKNTNDSLSRAVNANNNYNILSLGRDIISFFRVW